MGVLKNFAKFTGKHLCQGHLFNKVAGLRPPTLLKRILWEGVFLWIFVKFLRTPFLKEHLWWLLSTFKRRPGHLLNVLRMFNTRPGVSKLFFWLLATRTAIFHHHTYILRTTIHSWVEIGVYVSGLPMFLFWRSLWNFSYFSFHTLRQSII